MENNTEKKYKYIAFISYRHTKPDFEIAEKIHQMVENFKVPKELNEDGKYNEMRVFRDREELTTKDLSESLDEALRESEYLIIVCSKRTPLSPWCTREVSEFKKYHDDSKIIPILIEGEPYESFNEELTNLKSIEVDDKGNEIVKPLELLAADVRPEIVKDRNFEGYESLEAKKDPKLDELTKDSIKILKNTEIYRIMATILGVNYGDLKQRHKERRLRRMVQLSALVAVVLTIFGIAMTNLYFKAVEAEREATSQTSMMTLKVADQANLDGDRAFALLVSEEAMKAVDPRMANYDELNANYSRILNDALLSPKYSTQMVLNTDSEAPFYDVSRDGEYLVSGGELNTAIVWDLKNANIIKTLEFDAPVSAIKIKGDSKSFLVATKDSKLHLVDYETFEDKVVIESPGTYFFQIGLSENEKYIITIKSNKQFQYYDANNYSLVSEQVLNTPQITSLVTLRDESGYILLTDDGAVNMFDIETGELMKELEPVVPDRGAMRASSLSKNGKVFAYSGDRQITIYNIETGEKRLITDSVSYPTTLLLNSEGTVVFADSSLDINSWNTETLEFLRSFNLDKKSASRMALNNAEDKLVVAFDDDFSIAVFEDIQSPRDFIKSEMIKSVGSNHDNYIISVRFTKDDKYIITNSQDTKIKIISTDYGQSFKTLKGQIKAISSDNNLILLIDSENVMSTYNISEDKLIEMGELGEDFTTITTQYAISNDGKYFAFTDIGNYNVSVFGSDGYSIYDTKRHNSLSDFSIIPDIEMVDSADLLFTLGEDGEVYVFSLSSGEFIRSIKDKEEFAMKIIPSADGSLLGIEYLNGQTSILNVETGEMVQQIDGKVFKVIGEEGKLSRVLGQQGRRLFEFINGNMEFYASNDERKGITNRDYNYDFVSLDEKYLLTTISGGNAVVTDLKTGDRIRTLQAYGELLSKAVMNSDSTIVVFEYSNDETLVSKFYNTEELQKMADELIGNRELTDNEKSNIGIITRITDEQQ